MEDVM